MILSTDAPEELIVAQHGSPMIIGMSKKNGQLYVASEVSAFARHADDIIELEDGEIALLRSDIQFLTNEESSPEKVDFDRSRIYRSKYSSHESPVLPGVSCPAPWTHWTEKEIYEQPDAIYRALNFGGRMTQYGVTMGGLSLQPQRMLSIEHLIITGSGSSFNAALYGERLMRYVGAFDTVHAVEASGMDTTQLDRAAGGVLAVSQSGETRDILDAIGAVQEQLDLPCFSVVNGVGSRVARATKVGWFIYVNI